jgi:hypothetical protein
MFSQYSEVSVEFQLEDKSGNLLPSNHCQVVECGVRPVYQDEIHFFDLIMQEQDYHCTDPPDRDGLEAMFQAKRARFEGMRGDGIGYISARRKMRGHDYISLGFSNYFDEDIVGRIAAEFKKILR